MKRAIRRFARLLTCAGLLALLGLSLFYLVTTGIRVANDPSLSPIIERSAKEFSARLQADMARHAKPEVIEAKIAQYLAQVPRNWFAIKALEDGATDQGIMLSASLSQDMQRLWQEDDSI